MMWKLKNMRLRVAQKANGIKWKINWFATIFAEIIIDMVVFAIFTAVVIRAALKEEWKKWHS